MFKILFFVNKKLSFVCYLSFRVIWIIAFMIISMLKLSPRPLKTNKMLLTISPGPFFIEGWHRTLIITIYKVSSNWFIIVDSEPITLVYQWHFYFSPYSLRVNFGLEIINIITITDVIFAKSLRFSNHILYWSFLCLLFLFKIVFLSAVISHHQMYISDLKYFPDSFILYCTVSELTTLKTKNWAEISFKFWLRDSDIFV